MQQWHRKRANQCLKVISRNIEKGRWRGKAFNCMGKSKSTKRVRALFFFLCYVYCYLFKWKFNLKLATDSCIKNILNYFVTVLKYGQFSYKNEQTIRNVTSTKTEVILLVKEIIEAKNKYFI